MIRTISRRAASSSGGRGDEIGARLSTIWRIPSASDDALTEPARRTAMPATSAI